MANITLHDVARAAGVSHTTVSWSLRDDSRISAATRQKVLSAAHDLGYVPNETARSLARGRTCTIAIVSPAFSAAFESETLRGIEAEMSENHPDYALVQYSTGGNPQRASQIYDQLLRGNKADAVICLADPPALGTRLAYRHAGKTLVVFDEAIDDTASIRGDSRLGTRLATELLLDTGCKLPGIISSRIVEDGRPSCNPDRAASFSQICAARGINGHSLHIDHFHFDLGKRLARSIRDQHWDGVFCAAGDMVAIGIMAGCRDLGVRIPADLRLVGYDNLLISAMVHPALTTIAQPLEAMGRQAVRSCFQIMETGANTAEPSHITFSPTLVRRETT